MSKILFLADIHGNMPAVAALEKEINRLQPDDIYFLGDAVGKGPESGKSLQWVKEHCRHFIAGNWDRYVAEGRKNNTTKFPELAFHWNQLSLQDIDLLLSWPLEDEILISGYNFRLFHGRPVDKNYHQWLNPDELSPGFTNKAGKTFNGFICGDCHQAYIRECKEGFALNTGSVGNSLGVPRCSALLLEGDLNSTEKSPLYMTSLDIPYDNNRAVEIARNTPNMPDCEAYIREIQTGIYRGNQ
ncbi:MAG: metallophosphatase family protein [Treponema sp.]|nr:metallophosphatase family protein [Treponema sp.]